MEEPLRVYQTSNNKGERRFIISAWPHKRVARMLEIWGFEIETVVLLEEHFGAPVSILR